MPVWVAELSYVWHGDAPQLYLCLLVGVYSGCCEVCPFMWLPCCVDVIVLLSVCVCFCVRICLCLGICLRSCRCVKLCPRCVLKTPPPGIEPGSSAWQAEILTTILQRIYITQGICMPRGNAYPPYHRSARRMGDAECNNGHTGN